MGLEHTDAGTFDVMHATLDPGNGTRLATAPSFGRLLGGDLVRSGPSSSRPQLGDGVARAATPMLDPGARDLVFASFDEEGDRETTGPDWAALAAASSDDLAELLASSLEADEDSGGLDAEAVDQSLAETPSERL
jgi:hypothetical protein